MNRGIKIAVHLLWMQNESLTMAMNPHLVFFHFRRNKNAILLFTYFTHYQNFVLLTISKWFAWNYDFVKRIDASQYQNVLCRSFNSFDAENKMRLSRLMFICFSHHKKNHLVTHPLLWLFCFVFLLGNCSNCARILLQIMRKSSCVWISRIHLLASSTRVCHFLIIVAVNFLICCLFDAQFTLFYCSQHINSSTRNLH